jgi:drug/metabolite transporter (DMT)-like permease
MTPATCLGTVLACIFGALNAGHLAVGMTDLAWLVIFGAINLGLGLALFATGARLIPAALAALIGTVEPVLGPVWVWLIHGEAASTRTIIGGSMVCLALLTHLGLDWHWQRRKLTSAA